MRTPLMEPEDWSSLTDEEQGYYSTPGLPLTPEEAATIAEWFNIPAEELLDNQ
jgi:hypothetical protein